jgi:hypothetical protein
VDDLPAVLRTVVVGVAAYVALIVALRVSGKRTLTKWNAFDFVVTIALGSVLATALTSSQVSLAQVVTAFVVLIALQFVITWLSVRSRLVRRWTKSRLRLLLRHGRFDERALKKSASPGARSSRRCADPASAISTASLPWCSRPTAASASSRTPARQVRWRTWRDPAAATNPRSVMSERPVRTATWRRQADRRVTSAIAGDAWI